MEDCGLCENCKFTRGELPCHHPIAREEMSKKENSGHYAHAKAYAAIRKRLDLKFKPSSWRVAGCKGHVLK